MVVPLTREAPVRTPEVEPGARHLRRPADGDVRVVHRRVPGRLQPQPVPARRARAGARQVPVAVVGQVHHRRRVRHRLVRQRQRTVLLERVHRGQLQTAGEVPLARGAHPGQPQRVVAVRLDPPDPLVVALVPAVQAVRPVVAGQHVLDAVQGEAGAADPVGVPADQRAVERAGELQVPVELVEAQHHVGRAPVTVGRLDRLDDAAVGQDPHPHPGTFQGPPVDRGAVGEGAEEFTCHDRHPRP